MVEPFTDAEEMVYNKEDGKIMAGGYLVNSLLLQEGQPATYQSEDTALPGALQGGKSSKTKFSDRFKHLAVPAGLFYIQNNNNNNNKQPHNNNKQHLINDTEIVNDDLYEKLLKLAREDEGTDDKSESIHIKKKKPTKKKKNKKVAKHKTKRRY